MMVMISVLELALTVSPALIPTETTVPLIGLVRVAAPSDCSTSVRLASAVSIAAWSDAICCGVSVFADEPPPVGEPPPSLLEPAPVSDDPPDPVLPVPVLPVTALVSSATACVVEDDPEFAAALLAGVLPDPVPDEAAARAWPSAVSSFDTVLWSVETTCSSPETVSRADSHVAWPAGVAVLAAVQSDWACARSAASFCWSFESAASSLVSVV